MKETKYKVNEVFRSVQAEGANTGKSAVFVRLSGCNLKCKFCDTAHETFFEMTKDELEAKIDELSHNDKSVLVVFTGGEPALQLKEDEPLAEGHPTAIETNGLLKVPSWIRWVTISPKTVMEVEKLKQANEVKVLCGMFSDEQLEKIEGIHSALYMQPMEKNGTMNTAECLKFIEKHPQWKLSV